MRTDLYKLVHKSQRRFLFETALTLGRADLERPAEQTRMASLVADVIHMLRDHSQNEKHYIHPLLAAPAELDAEHDAQELQLAQLEAVVAEQRWPELYPTMMRLIGDYLVHQDEEEKRQVAELWPRYTDEQLQRVFTRFHADRDPAVARADFLRMIPALNPQELAQVMKP